MRRVVGYTMTAAAADREQRERKRNGA
jgi:hypothetical protein